MSPSDDGMRNMKPVNVPDIKSACDKRMPAKKSGDAIIYLPEGDVEIKNVLHVPNISVNLLSVSKICEQGHTVTFNKKGCTITNADGNILASTKCENGVYKLRSAKKDIDLCMVAQKGSVSALTWHRRLGHMNAKSMQKMKNGAVIGVDYQDDDKAIKHCEMCPVGKHARSPFQNSGTCTSKLLELIYTVIMGPMKPQSIGHAKYLLTFIDDYSKKVFVYFLKSKDRTFVNFKSLVERQTEQKIKILRSDNGTEYCGETFQEYLRKRGIRHQTSNVYTPQQIGVAERMNRTLTEKARCLLYDAELPKIYWAEAINMACYIVNRSVFTSLADRTPEEIFTGQKFDLSALRVFGSEVMVHVPKQKRKKLDKKSRKLIFVGFEK